jgi:hypothetical protein
MVRLSAQQSMDKDGHIRELAFFVWDITGVDEEQGVYAISSGSSGL